MQSLGQKGFRFALKTNLIIKLPPWWKVVEAFDDAGDAMMISQEMRTIFWESPHVEE